ncbi:MAG: ATP-binding protein [Chloroherpetonaceae bacterium]|nr:ATP-binding protein [Chthonomonadaceae bacterium]MDW8207530.1 ATP-binding protein [Chloroherpetonaceae bacterium]
MKQCPVASGPLEIGHIRQHRDSYPYPLSCPLPPTHAGGTTYYLDFATGKHYHQDSTIADLIGIPCDRITEAIWCRLVERVELQGPLATLSLDEAIARRRSGIEPFWNAHYLIYSVDGDPRWISDISIVVSNASGEPAGSFGVLRDITQEKKHLQSMYRIQKLESIGKIASSIAHDFNNVLTAVIGYADLIRHHISEGHPAHHYLDCLQMATQKASTLTRQLLAFARQQTAQPRVLDINHLIQANACMLRTVLGERAHMTLTLHPEPLYVHLDADQFEHVLINMAVNARDAMPDGGEFAIATAPYLLDAQQQEYGPELQPGEYVRLTLSDTGIGMSDHVLRHLFEPFFTTKPNGAGTGLGLATCYSVVKQAGGHITVESQLGAGTCFSIFLPRTHAPACEAPETEVPMHTNGTETILLVEDEPQVREITVRALQRRGYHVLAAGNGPEALRTAIEFPRNIHLIVSDVVMPGMDGPELIYRLSAVHPEARVLLVSGNLDELNTLARPEGRIALLCKPYTMDTLALKIRQVLSEPASVPAPASVRG